MIGQKVIFSCNHIVNTLQSTANLYNVRRSEGDSIDNITNDGSVVDVLYIYQRRISPMPTAVYRKNIDYTVDGNNIIWRPHGLSPDPEHLYQCEVMITTRTVRDYSPNPDMCGRCSGQGWYVSIANDAYRAMSVVKGIEKLVQDYIKVIYTLKQPGGYGTNLLNLSGESVKNEDMFLADIGSELNSGALQIQQLQASILLTGDALLDPEEILSSLEILSMEYSPYDNAAYVQIKLVNKADNSSAAINFKF